VRCCAEENAGNVLLANDGTEAWRRMMALAMQYT
jgi:hypothetical protein